MLSLKFSTRFLASFCFAILFSLPLLAAEKAAKVNDWFGYHASKTEIWQFEANINDPRYLTIRLKDDVTSQGEKRKILVIYRKPSSAYDTSISQILNIFEQRQLNAELEVVFVGKDGDFTDKTLHTAKENGFDLVVGMGSSAARAVGRHFEGGNLPVVTVTAKDPVLMGQVKDYKSGSGNNFAYTSLNASADTIFNYLHQLKPDLENIAILYAKENESAVLTQYEPMVKLSANFNIHVEGVGVIDRSKVPEELAVRLPAAIKSLKERDPDLSKSLIWLTGSTSVFQEIKLINEIAGNLPVLSAVTNVVKEGNDSAVLSIGIGFESNAHLAAIYIMDILNGRDPGKMPVGEVNPPDIAINFMRAREIGMKVPFEFLEIASFVYDGDGKPVRIAGQASF